MKRGGKNGSKLTGLSTANAGTCGANVLCVLQSVVGAIHLFGNQNTKRRFRMKATSGMGLRSRVQLVAICALFVVGVLLSKGLAQAAQCAVTATSTAADVGWNPSQFYGLNWARLFDPG